MRKVIFGMAALAVLALTGPARADTDAGTTMRGHVARVDAPGNQLTVRTGDGNEVTVHVDPDTRVVVAGQPGKLNQLNSGDAVRVRYVTRGGDRHALLVKRSPTSLADVKRETNQALEAAKRYGFKQKDQYEHKLHGVLDDLDDRLDDLQQRARKATGQAAQDLREQVRQLKQRRGVVDQRLQQVKSATAETWDNVKDTVSDAVQEFQNFYERTRARFSK